MQLQQSSTKTHLDLKNDYKNSKQDIVKMFALDKKTFEDKSKERDEFHFKNNLNLSTEKLSVDGLIKLLEACEKQRASVILPPLVGSPAKSPTGPPLVGSPTESPAKSHTGPPLVGSPTESPAKSHKGPPLVGIPTESLAKSLTGPPNTIGKFDKETFNKLFEKSIEKSSTVAIPSNGNDTIVPYNAAQNTLCSRDSYLDYQNNSYDALYATNGNIDSSFVLPSTQIDLTHQFTTTTNYEDGIKKYEQVTAEIKQSFIKKNISTVEAKS